MPSHLFVDGRDDCLTFAALAHAGLIDLLKGAVSDVEARRHWLQAGDETRHNNDR